MHAVTRAALLTLAASLGCASGTSFDAAVYAAADKSCTLEGPAIVAFGSYDPMSNAAVDAQGQVSYQCSNKKPSGRNSPVVQISLGPGRTGNYNRELTGPRDVLRYNLYLDVQRTTVWGDGTAGTQTYSAKVQPNNKLVTVPVFGRIFGAQDVGAGYYLDNLVVTLDF